MSGIQMLKSWIGALTDLGLMLLALGIVCALLVGGANIPFFGNVTANIMAIVKELGANGLVGLIALGIIQIGRASCRERVLLGV